MNLLERLPIIGDRIRQQRRIRLFRLIFTGFAMGSADIVPGVSGGTIALLLGVYEELIFSIKTASGQALTLAVQGKLNQAFKAIPWGFLLPLGTGIGLAIISLANLLTWLLDNQPVYTWSFFFGLVVASSWVVAQRIKNWQLQDKAVLLLATLIAFLVVGLVPVQTPDTLLAFFLSGTLAIIAMILPGISGSFILVILGKYEQVLSAVLNHDLIKIGTFGLGAALGLVVFARLLSWLLNNHHDLLMAALVGFMIGSLRKLWPYKLVLSTTIDRHGDIVPLVEKNILPSFTRPDFFASLLLAALAFSLIWYLQKLELTKEQTADVNRKQFTKEHKRALKKER